MVTRFAVKMPISTANNSPIRKVRAVAATLAARQPMRIDRERNYDKGHESKNSHRRQAKNLQIMDELTPYELDHVGNPGDHGTKVLRFRLAHRGFDVANGLLWRTRIESDNDVG